MYQIIIVTDHTLDGDAVCLAAHSPANTPVILTTDFGLSYENFTLLHAYSSMQDGSVLLNHSVCGSVCGQQCNSLGITNYTNWEAVLEASPDTCFASKTSDGTHGPYIHQTFNGFGAYATANPGVFPAALTTTTSVAPTVAYPEKASDDHTLTIALSIGGGITVLAVAAVVAYSCRDKIVAGDSSSPSVSSTRFTTTDFY